MSDIVIVEMLQRWNQYQTGERVGVSRQTADMWTGIDSPQFKVANELSAEDSARYFNTASRDKQVKGAVTK